MENAYNEEEDDNDDSEDDDEPDIHEGAKAREGMLNLKNNYNNGWMAKAPRLYLEVNFFNVFKS